MSRRKRTPRGRSGSIRREDVVLVLDREYDDDGPVTSDYSIAVDVILEALEGLWFDSADSDLERSVNAHVQAIKQKIQADL